MICHICKEDSFHISDYDDFIVECWSLNKHVSTCHKELVQMTSKVISIRYIKARYNLEDRALDNMPD
jgi:hypothetical protein